MPAAKPISPDLVQILFDYDADSGLLTPKPTAARAARRVSPKQWEVSGVQYSLHRLIWAWHNPDNANPKYVGFVDGNRANTRIENLTAISANPRWEGHKKVRRARLNDDGMLIYEELVNAALEARYKAQAQEPAYTLPAIPVPLKRRAAPVQQTPDTDPAREYFDQLDRDTEEESRARAAAQAARAAREAAEDAEWDAQAAQLRRAEEERKALGTTLVDTDPEEPR